MSNHARRRPTYDLKDAALNDIVRWERQAQVQDVIDGHRTHFYVGSAKHDVTFEEIGPSMFAVYCSCGFSAPAPFGEQHAERVKEAHLFRYKVIADPRGAKYRA